MAMFDDTQWLLSHIQNSYATSDDSGLSEIVLQSSWPVEKLVDFPFLYPDDSLTADRSAEEAPHSPDVHSDQSFVGRRVRLDTEHRLDKMRKEKNLQAEITRITWQPNTSQLSEAEAEELFGVKPVRPIAPLMQQTSLLSQLLDQDDLDQNPYLEYAQWDASTDVNVATKRLSIFVYSSDRSQVPDFPVKVVVNSAAKVIDVIGLTCFLYTRDNYSPPLQDPPSAFSLRMADEDGSVDWEFMPFIHSHVIEKFGFKVLAIAKEQHKDQQHCPDQPVTVTVHISGGVFSLIECESRDIQLREVLNRTIAKRREMARVVEAGVQYNLEKEDEPGRPLSLDRSLAEVDTLVLHAVRDNSKRATSSDSGVLADEGPDVLQSFAVTWVKKWAKFDATIDVSSGGVLMAVTGGGSGGLLRPPHPVSYSSNKILCCKLKTSGGGSSSNTSKKVNLSKDKFSSEGASSGGGKFAGGGKKGGASIEGSSSNSRGGPGGDRCSRGGGDTVNSRCEVLLTCQGEQQFKDYILQCDESVGLELVEAVRRIKIDDSSREEKEKPRRRYSFVGLKKKNRASYGGMRGPPN